MFAFASSKRNEEKEEKKLCKSSIARCRVNGRRCWLPAEWTDELIVATCEWCDGGGEGRGVGGEMKWGRRNQANRLFLIAFSANLTETENSFGVLSGTGWTDGSAALIEICVPNRLSEQLINGIDQHINFAHDTLSIDCRIECAGPDLVFLFHFPAMAMAPKPQSGKGNASVNRNCKCWKPFFPDADVYFCWICEYNDAWAGPRTKRMQSRSVDFGRGQRFAHSLTRSNQIYDCPFAILRKETHRVARHHSNTFPYERNGVRSPDTFWGVNRQQFQWMKSAIFDFFLSLLLVPRTNGRNEGKRLPN